MEVALFTENLPKDVDIIEEEREEAEKYNTEWNPYEDEDFETESYEEYYNDDDDENELPRGY